MAVSNIKALIPGELQKVWELVLNTENYAAWRSDLSKTEAISDKQFIEYTKNGYPTVAFAASSSGATAARAASSGRRSPKRTDRATHIRGYGTAGKTGDAARWIRNAAHVRGERRGECTSCGFAPKRTDMKGDGEDGQCSALMRS